MQSKGKKSADDDCNVYIANLPHDLGKNRLYALFSPYGKIIRHKFVAPQNLSEPGYGFVQFRDKFSAANAIKALTDYTFPTGEKIYTSLALHRRSSLSDEPTNLYVKNVPQSWNSDILRREFSEFGSIRQCKIIKDGIAFVRFCDHNQALNAIDALNGKYMEKTTNCRPLHIEFATRKSAANSYQTQSIPTTKDNEHNLYVRNLPYSFTQKQLETLFKVYGKISAAKLGSKGIAFVRFVHAEDAQYCISKLHRTKPDGFEAEIVVKLAHFDIGDCRNRANGNFKPSEVLQKAQSMQSNVDFEVKNMNNSPLQTNNLLNGNNNNNNNQNVNQLMNNLNLFNLNLPNVQPPANLMPINVNLPNVPSVPLAFAVPNYSPSMPLVGQIPQFPMQGQMGYIIPPPQLISVGLNSPLFATNNTPPPQQQQN